MFTNAPLDIVLTNNFAAIGLAYLYQHIGHSEKAENLIAASADYTRNAPLRGWSGNRIADVLLHSLRGEKTKALRALERAVAKGWRNQWGYALDHDQVLATLRSENDFLSLRKKIDTDFARQLKQLESWQTAGQRCS